MIIYHGIVGGTKLLVKICEMVARPFALLIPHPHGCGGGSSPLADRWIPGAGVLPMRVGGGRGKGEGVWTVSLSPPQVVFSPTLVNLLRVLYLGAPRVHFTAA